MSDQLGLFDRHGEDDTGELDLDDLRAALTRTAAAAPTQRRPPGVPRREQRAARLAAARRRKRRTRQTVLAVVVLLLLIAGGVVAFKWWRTDSTAIPDFQGTGTTETVVRVSGGDSLTDIADTLATDNVVASSKAFVAAASNNADVAKIKTGFYKVRLHASAAAAVTALTASTARVGELRLIPGQQLADVTAKNGKVTDGYISQITKAACVPLNGVSNCFDAAALWQVEQTADPKDLRVVSWAWNAIAKAPDPKKRLEGMLVPGDYDIQPGSTPLEALQQVMQASAANWNATDIVADAAAVSRSPYDVAIVASLIEREGNSTSMTKVARVTYNRLAISMRLQFDSTVDYALGKSQVSTTSAERENPSPYNTYLRAGLPPTPITSPGPAALDAALNPDDGNWLFFVKIAQGQNGAFCFSQTFAQHTKCVAQARAAGVFGG
ncbi:endolytic transglycosylase MltG [Nakamurella sp. PAMC28650]|uniref:endolytic transglycosylase MltG n=1 Tax=Nakamurella sp. PAMC28650 TaxID=2762325 RepID=UPI00164E404E|nr:endolytic transglycosylase MltG [Nakamurella sp. PAMC28650]QNK79581.1 endolytic transglycosylase MltG [Nakamurella sp. PAMC28650]